MKSQKGDLLRDSAQPGADLNVGRRRFIGGAVALTATGLSLPGVANVPVSQRTAGAGFSNYGVPGTDQEEVIRWISSNASTPGNGASWSPLHDLVGTVTPNGLHYERHHNGVPDVDADEYELAIFGEIARPVAFSIENLHRFQQVSRNCFIECGGNSNSYWLDEPVQAKAGYLHGLISSAEWTGVLLSDLLKKVEPNENARWLIVDGLDSAGVTVSIPIEKAMDDVIVALYQNGEAIRPENGYPARLVVPGWEGIVNVKWIHSIQLARQPLMSRFDSVSYTDLQHDGRARRFTFEVGVKSLITNPSPGIQLVDHGDYEIHGLAWSGAGHIKRVEVSIDAGTTWTDAVLQQPVLDHSWVRFRAPWRWQGEGMVLQSRATDSAGNVQPTRQALIAEQGKNPYYHYNGIVSWVIADDGFVENSHI